MSVKETNLVVPDLKMCNGVKMPQIGFGLYQVNENVETVVKEAFEVGYRQFDGASFYKNEKAFGDAVTKLKIPRESYFVTSKVWNDMAGYETTLQSAEQSLKDLQTHYFDLFLVHWPVPGKHTDTWKAVMKLYNEGKAKAIGVSNYLQSDYKELENAGLIDDNLFPMVNQLNISPLYYDESLIKYNKDKKMLIQAYKPLERGDDSLLKNETIINLSKKYEMTPAQLILKWVQQKEMVILVKSIKKERMSENIAIFNKKNINNEDIAKMDSLTNQNTLKTWKERYLKRKWEYATNKQQTQS